MGYSYGVVVVVVILAVIASVVKKGKGRASRGAGAAEASPFRRNKFFLTTAEQSFFGCLKEAISGRWELFAKVRLLDLLWLPRETQDKQRWRNTVQSKHVDFLLCDRKTLMPLLAVELDDSSHRRPDRQERDDFVNKVLESAGIPVLRATARSLYDTRALGEEIQKMLGAKPQESPVA